MSSKRETLLAGIKTALERIDGTGSYTYTLTSETVQRTRHSIVDAEHIVNEFRTRPMILIKAGNEEWDATQTVDVVNKSLSVTLLFLFDGGAGCAEVNNALRDIERALFTSWAGFGAGVTTWSAAAYQIEPEDGEAIDGVYVQVTCNYSNDYGDPDAGG